MLILWYFEYTTVVIISENTTSFKSAALGLHDLCDNESFYNNSQWYPVSIQYVHKKMQLDAFGNEFGGALVQLGA